MLCSQRFRQDCGPCGYSRTRPACNGDEKEQVVGKGCRHLPVRLDADRRFKMLVHCKYVLPDPARDGDFYSGGLHAQTSSGNVQSSSGAAAYFKRSKRSAAQLSELFGSDRPRPDQQASSTSVAHHPHMRKMWPYGALHCGGSIAALDWKSGYWERAANPSFLAFPASRLVILLGLVNN